MEDFKIKPLTKEQLVISFDRLTRFKNTETKYLRVFTDIITHNLIYPKYSKSELENADCSFLRDMAEKIINFSLGDSKKPDLRINKKISEYEKSVFKFTPKTEKLLDNSINYSSFLELIGNTPVKNLQWLKELTHDNDMRDVRRKKSLHFPIEAVILAEGATEEILLPEFAKLCNYDFDKEGIYLISAGGKNQVVKLYYEISETLKLPIFVLLDKDGLQNSLEIQPKLRKCDKIHLLKCGEFEDLLPFDLIKRTLEYELQNISLPVELQDSRPRVKFLEEIFKNRGLHEFKKASFAQSIALNIKNSSDITSEIADIISEIKNLKDAVDN